MNNKSASSILIVDDELIVATDIQNSLKKLAYKIAGIATSADEAIKLAIETNPDLIIMDIMLKGEKDGIFASEEIQKKCDIPIIFLTAYSDQATLERAKKIGPFAYLVKPFADRELYTAVETSLFKHKLELKIKESESLFRTTLYSIGDAVITTDINGFVLNMNPVAEQLTGYTETESKGIHLNKIFNIVNEETRIPVENPVELVLLTGKIIGLANHTLLISKDGTETPIADSGAPIKNERGEIKGVVLVFRDQTKEREIENKLRESELRYYTFINSTNDYIFMKDENRNYIICNNALSEFLNKPESEIKNHTDFELMPEKLAEQCKISDDKVYTDKMLVISEEIFNDVYFETTKFPVLLPDGKTGVGGYIKNITSRKQYEQELKKQMNELLRSNKLMIGRELRMVELKKEVNELLEKMNLEKRYDI